MKQEIIYCNRIGIDSQVDVYLSYHDMASNIGDSNIPQHIKDINTNMSYPRPVRWGVDIESIGTNVQRFYVGAEYQNETKPELQGSGYKFNSDNELLEYNEYKIIDDKLIVDKYDADGNILDAGGEEVECGDDEWTGNTSILNTVQNSGNHYFVLKKLYANQTYLRYLINEPKWCSHEHKFVINKSKSL